MGFRLKIVVSSPIDLAQAKSILTEAQSQWPFIALPAEDTIADHAHFALPELTSYVLETESEQEIAEQQNENVERQLPEFSKSFPTVTFAFIEADCFGGTCGYGGFACAAGAILLQSSGQPSSLDVLVAAIGVKLKGGYFAPFTRGYFKR